MQGARLAGLMMISVLIETGPAVAHPGRTGEPDRDDRCDDEVALAVTLASLVPAAAQGLVREVVVADPGRSPGIGQVADAVGCRLVEGGRAEALPHLRGDWVLMLRPGLRLEADWTREAQAFVDWAESGGPDGARDRAAVFRLMVDRFGLSARLREWVSARPGRWRADVAVLARREALMAGRRLRLRRIRAKLYQPD